MRIVITGATGFIGSNLAKLFLEKGAEVFALVRPESSHLEALPKHEKLHMVSCGLSNVMDCIGQIGQADAFFHLAWGGVNRQEIDSPQVQAKNVAGSLECIRAAKELGCTMFMDAGSRVEYGLTDGFMQEDIDCHPVNQYGKAKWEFYQKAAPLCTDLGIHYVHLRFFSVYGTGDHPWSIISTLVRELPAGNKVSLSACRHQWNFMYIDDAVEAVYDSTDGTRDVIRELCRQNPKIKAIFNARNFGQFNSPYYGMLQVTGDCVIEMVADFQDPVEMIPKYVHEWEKGYKIVIGIKTSSKENKVMYWLRTCYYKVIKKMSEVEQIEHFTGSGLYDREFIEILRKLDDPTPFLRGIVAELGYKRKEIPYEQPKRRAGKTHNNFYRLYDAAMLSVTSYTKEGLRLATIFGGICAAGSMIIALVYLVMKLIWWDRFPAGMAPMLIGMLFLGSVQLFFIGFLGEYIMSINQRVMKRPLVIEEERLNFDQKRENANKDVNAKNVDTKDVDTKDGKKNEV